MHRTRRAVKVPIVEASSDSEDDIPLKKLRRSPIKKISTPEKKLTKDNATSSSESDIENYLQPINEIDLNSSFFNIQKKHQEEFNKIEKDIFAGVTRRLSDSDSDEEMNEVEPSVPQEDKLSQEDLEKPSTSSSGMKLNFQQLEAYTKKIEEAKKHVEQYNARKKAEEHNMDISNLLAAGETKKLTLDNIQPEDLHSSDFESCDSEREDWEEVKIKESQESKEKTLVPKDGLQITVNMPETCRKKKGIDLLAAMKRRLNRIRKENQVYVHKVHLLCWVAHGNYVNDVINNTQILALALSLIPSDKCYPSDRPDLSYLEQIVQWYKKTIKLTEKPVPKDLTLVNAIQLQISRKEVYNQKLLVYIFIAILRALGIQCRLVLSFQLEPLRPPASDLHSLSKENIKKEVKVKDKTKKTSVKEERSHDEEKDTDTKQVKKSGEKKEGKAKSVPKKDEASKKELTKKESTTVRKKEEKGDNKKANSKKSAIPEKESGKKEIRNTVRSKEVDKREDSKKCEVLEKKPKEASKKEESSVSDKKELMSNPKKGEKAEPSKDKETSKKKLKNEESKIKETKTPKGNTLTVEKDKNIQSKSEENKSKKDQKAEPSKNKETNKKKLKSEESKVKEIKMSKGNTLTVEKDKNIRSKSEEIKTKVVEKSTQKNTERLTVKDTTNRRSKSAEAPNERQTRSKTTTKKDIIKIKLPRKEKPKEVPQLDGINNSSDEDISYDIIYTYDIPQLDGADDNNAKKTVKAKKPNLKKLSTPAEETCEKKKHPSRLKATAEEYNSENEFRPRSPFTKKNTESPKQLRNKRLVNLQKLKSPKEATVRPHKSPPKQLNIKNDIVNLIKGRIAEQKHIDRSRTVKRKPLRDDDSDSDYMQEPIKKKHHDSDSDLDYFVPKPKVKKRVSSRNTKVDQKILSSESDVDKTGKKKKINVWAEVFLENEEKWISVDVVHGQVHCINELYMRATHPVSYIVAWNNDNCLKDITMRYCRNFNTITRKLRVDAKWWEETLKPFRGRYTAKDKEEDDDLNRQQLDQPLPKSIAEYKNHPLYALRRHLLKFEDIYPPDIQPLGYVRGEPVYPRNCVYVCRSRDIWLKEAKVVKPGEKPYKIVKARPKYDKLSNSIITDQLLEIFGEWQTMDYEPPTAENGVVPRNAFGNVELFKACMLPKGTVHLKLPGLNKICRRMDIDCVSAIVGFDFHGGWSHPTYDGFVVCEEYADKLVAAWELEQDEIERKENEKIEKRVYGNWRKLIRGLLIRERLKAKYDFGNTGEGGREKKKAKGPRFCTKKRRVYSGSESESDKT